MRGRIVDIPRFAKRDGLWNCIAGWWADVPVRRREFWYVLLFQPGQGWLRWGVVHDTTTTWNEYGYEPEDVHLTPPLRRVGMWLAWWPRSVWLMTVGVKVEEVGGGRYRYSWEEARPSWADVSWMVDDQRYADLWGWNWKAERQRKRARRKQSA